MTSVSWDLPPILVSPTKMEYSLGPHQCGLNGPIILRSNFSRPWPHHEFFLARDLDANEYICVSAGSNGCYEQNIGTYVMRRGRKAGSGGHHTFLGLALI